MATEQKLEKIDDIKCWMESGTGTTGATLRRYDRCCNCIDTKVNQPHPNHVCVCVLFYYTPFSSAARGVFYIIHRNYAELDGFLAHS